jgi:hypothetical protein
MGEGWTLVQAPDGGISGVASKSQDMPSKQDNFPPVVQNFVGAAHYSDWVFVFDSGTILTPSSGSLSSVSNPLVPQSGPNVDITNAR